MEGFVIEYLSDVLGTIKMIACIASLLFGILFLLAYIFNDEYSEKVWVLGGKFKALVILSFLLAIFLPSTMKYDYVNHYIKENAQLQKQLNQMDYLIQKYELQQQLDALRK